MGSARWDLERMRSVVREWDEALRAELPAYARLVPEAEARGSVLREPATEEDVLAAERRLGIAFPPSYRSFLLLSDGADAGIPGASHLLRTFGRRGGGLLPVADVVPLSKAVPWLVPMWRDAMAEFIDEQEEPFLEARAQVFDFEPAKHALLISAPERDETLALVPFEGEWQVWFFGYSEVDAHESFAAFLRNQTRAAEKRVAERAGRVERAAADGRSWTEVEDLAAHRDPRAVDAACRALEHGDADQAALRLVYLGDPAAIPALRATLDRCIRRPSPEPPDHERRQLASFLLRALDSCGDPNIEAELEKIIAEGPPDVVHLARQYLSSRDESPRW